MGFLIYVQGFLTTIGGMQSLEELLEGAVGCFWFCSSGSFFTPRIQIGRKEVDLHRLDDQFYTVKRYVKFESDWFDVQVTY